MRGLSDPFRAASSQEENSCEQAVVVLEEVEEQEADHKAQGQAAESDEAELPAGLLVLLLVLGATVVRVGVEPPLVAVGQHLAEVEQVL